MRFFCDVLRSVLCALLLLGPALAAAQAPAPVVMLSDIHFDPFHDPAKVAQLRADPIEHWPAILRAAASATQAADLQAVQEECHARALDTAWPLLQTALTAAHDAQPHPVFVTLSGDLLTHEFPCRFQRLVPGATPAELSDFAAKTVAFVVLQLRLAFPHVPVYTALGNNDSGCEDYRETAGDAFLRRASDDIAVAAGANPRPEFSPEGDYSVALPAPIQRGRLIVLQNIFESREYNTCAAAADRNPEKAQMDWLRSQLSWARGRHEHVWVMAHIPPGIDVYASFHRYVLRPAEMCSAAPRPYLADTALADTLLDFSDVIRLALFGHTHMDEIRLLRRGPGPAADGKATALPAEIPAKLVPSVTPFAGNHPAFLVGYVDPHTATLKDWRTFVSPGAQGSSAPWTQAYRFSTAYHLPDFSAASALKLADGFTADKTGQDPASSTMREHVYPGDIGIYALGLAQIWPAYACAIREDRPSAFHVCLCGSGAPAQTPAQP